MQGPYDEPTPVPDLETWKRAITGVYPPDLAASLLADMREPADSGWTGFATDLNPVILGILVLDAEFATWYEKRYPDRAAIVRELRGLPEAEALEEIRKGRWL